VGLEPGENAMKRRPVATSPAFCFKLTGNRDARNFGGGDSDARADASCGQNDDRPYRQWALKNSSLGVPSASKTACVVTWKLADEPSAFVSLPFNVNVVSAFPKAVPVSVIAPLLPNQTV
jgi:hypothetical protein